MNSKTLIASVSLALFSVAGHASDATQFATEASTLTRAEVQAELARARAAGELNERGDSYGTATVTSGSTLSRAAVLAELRQARTSGSLDNAGDSYGSFRAADLASTKTRAEVRAQIRNGGLSRGNYTNYAGG